MTDAIPSFRRAILYRICFCLGLSELTLPIGLPPLFTFEEDFEEREWKFRVELEDEDEPGEDKVEEEERDEDLESEVISSLLLHSCGSASPRLELIWDVVKGASIF